MEREQGLEANVVAMFPLTETHDPCLQGLTVGGSVTPFMHVHAPARPACQAIKYARRQRPCHPRLLAVYLLYGRYARVFSALSIERVRYEDLALRAIAGTTTISRFQVIFS